MPHETIEQMRQRDAAEALRREAWKGDITRAALTLREAAIRVLAEHCPEPGYGCFIRTVARDMGVSHDLARAVLRDLRADGDAVYMPGLWSEDGSPAGAGYGLTESGRAVLRTLTDFRALPDDGAP